MEVLCFSYSWCATMCFCLVGGYIIALNAGVLWNLCVNKTHSSWIPLAGAVLFSLGMIFSKSELLNKYWWIAFLVDYGSIPGFLHALYAWLFVTK